MFFVNVIGLSRSFFVAHIGLSLSRQTDVCKRWCRFLIRLSCELPVLLLSGEC
jgi:hypothetical protein